MVSIAQKTNAFLRIFCARSVDLNFHSTFMLSSPQEWGFQGLIMSDWTGVYSVDESILAGLDLEMRAPPFVLHGWLL